MITEYPFDNASNYLFDTSKIKVENGEASLKSLVKSSETCFCNFDSLAVKRSRDSGSLVVTPFGGANVSGKWLDLAHNDRRYVSIDANLNADSQQVGCIRSKYRPNYNSAPADEIGILAISTSLSSLNNLLYLRHRGAGDLRLHIRDSGGVLVSETVLLYWNPILNQVYEIEINYDFTNGETRIFIDGLQVGPVITTICARSADIGLLRFGSSYDGIRDSNFSITDIQIFDTIQHTANFASEIPRSEPTTYVIDNPTIITSPQAMDALEGFECDIEKAGLDEVKNTIFSKWFDSIWKDSDGTYAESNTELETETNKATLDLSSGHNVPIKSFLHSETGYTTPKLKNIKLDYNFHIMPDDNVNECMISVRLDDLFQDLIDFSTLEAKLIIELENSFQQGDRTVFKYIYSINFDNTGYAEKSIRETANVNKKIKFKIEYKNQDNETTTINYKDAIIPDEKSKKLSEISSIETS